MDFDLPPGGMNPTRAEANWAPVIVGGAFQTGLNLMRDLLSHGVRAVAVDYDLTHQGFHSVIGMTYHCPNPDFEGEAWTAFMLKLAAELGQKPVFIAAADVFVMALAKHGNELSASFLNSPEDSQLQADLCSKETQYALCQEHGFPIPRLAYVRSRAELDRFIADARFPCLIKPLSPRAWDACPATSPAHGKKILIAETADELQSVYDQVALFCPEAVAQEIIAGLGDRKRLYFSTFGQGGKPLGECLMQEVRAHPALGAMAQVIRPIADDGLIALCGDFLAKIGYRGICEFEVKLDERDGKPLLIEINPRFSGSGDASSYTGVETGWLHYLDMIGYPVAYVKPTRFDFHHIFLKLEADITPPFVLSGAISWKDLLAPYRGRRAYFDLNWRDRGLARATLTRCARSIAGALWRYAFKRAAA